MHRKQQPVRTPAAIRNRARELRKTSTHPEKMLWRSLRNRRLAGFKFRRQHPIGRFIADFFCDDCQLIIELDGEIHAAQKEYDEQRTHWLKTHGHTVLRFTNRDVENNLDSVLHAIVEKCKSLRRNRRGA